MEQTMRIAQVGTNLAEAQRLAFIMPSADCGFGLSPCNGSICCEKMRKLEGLCAANFFDEDMQ
jgi:hypothetical protein